MSKEKETSGAKDGEATAIVSASLMPITKPAIKGPSGRPSPPSITQANTTPTQA